MAHFAQGRRGGGIDYSRFEEIVDEEEEEEMTKPPRREAPRAGGAAEGAPRAQAGNAATLDAMIEGLADTDPENVIDILKGGGLSDAQVEAIVGGDSSEVESKLLGALSGSDSGGPGGKRSARAAAPGVGASLGGRADHVAAARARAEEGVRKLEERSRREMDSKMAELAARKRQLAEATEEVAKSRAEVERLHAAAAPDKARLDAAGKAADASAVGLAALQRTEDERLEQVRRGMEHEVHALREQARASMRAKKEHAAVQAYTQALEYLEALGERKGRTVAEVLCSRALAYSRCGAHGLAAADAARAVKSDPGWAKAHFRCAHVAEQAGDVAGAVGGYSGLLTALATRAELALAAMEADEASGAGMEAVDALQRGADPLITLGRSAAPQPCPSSEQVAAVAARAAEAARGLSALSQRFGTQDAGLAVQSEIVVGMSDVVGEVEDVRRALLRCDAARQPAAVAAPPASAAAGAAPPLAVGTRSAAAPPTREAASALKAAADAAWQPPHWENFDAHAVPDAVAALARRALPMYSAALDAAAAEGAAPLAAPSADSAAAALAAKLAAAALLNRAACALVAGDWTRCLADCVLMLCAGVQPLRTTAGRGGSAGGSGDEEGARVAALRPLLARAAPLPLLQRAKALLRSAAARRALGDDVGAAEDEAAAGQAAADAGWAQAPSPPNVAASTSSAAAPATAQQPPPQPCRQPWEQEQALMPDGAHLQYTLWLPLYVRKVDQTSITDVDKKTGRSLDVHVSLPAGADGDAAPSVRVVHVELEKRVEPGVRAYYSTMEGNTLKLVMHLAKDQS